MMEDRKYLIFTFTCLEEPNLTGLTFQQRRLIKLFDRAL
jgi:hypothetical protein